MIRAERSPGRLRVRGHAGFAPAGADIVCAAVSILCETLASGLPASDKRLGPGFAEFRGGGADFDFAWRGLRLLAGSFPENVEAVEKCPDSL